MLLDAKINGVAKRLSALYLWQHNKALNSSTGHTSQQVLAILTQFFELGFGQPGTKGDTPCLNQRG